MFGLFKRSQKNQAESQSSDVDTDEDAQKAMAVKLKCDIAQMSVEGLNHTDDELRSYERERFAKIRSEAIAILSTIKDEFYQGFSAHQLINLCMAARDGDMARALLLSVRDEFLLEQIFKDNPSLNMST
ncbi:hypothetical protein AB4Y85_08275 [Microvirga sp. 2YAF29]|uniref:hypothetical protein n=1 Tax=Microvirga sp. 2YAF29 TaxID=3233031 RepID=UPI003F9A52F1